jgi:hypothetical protein
MFFMVHSARFSILSASRRLAFHIMSKTLWRCHCFMAAVLSGISEAGRVAVISESVSPASVNTKFRSVTVPVVVMEPLLFDDCGMTGLTSGTDYGSASSQTAIVSRSDELAQAIIRPVATSTPD